VEPSPPAGNRRPTPSPESPALVHARGDRTGRPSTTARRAWPAHGGAGGRSDAKGWASYLYNCPRRKACTPRSRPCRPRERELPLPRRRARLPARELRLPMVLCSSRAGRARRRGALPPTRGCGRWYRSTTAAHTSTAPSPTRRDRGDDPAPRIGEVADDHTSLHRRHDRMPKGVKWRQGDLPGTLPAAFLLSAPSIPRARGAGPRPAWLPPRAHAEHDRPLADARHRLLHLPPGAPPGVSVGTLEGRHIDPHDLWRADGPRGRDADGDRRRRVRQAMVAALDEAEAAAATYDLSTLRLSSPALCGPNREAGAHGRGGLLPLLRLARLQRGVGFAAAITAPGPRLPRPGSRSARAPGCSTTTGGP